MNSTIKETTKIEEGKEIILTKLFADPAIVQQHRSQLMQIFKDAKATEIEQKIQNIVVKENVFNAVMEDLSKHFEFTFDEAELKLAKDKIKNNFISRGAKDIPEDALDNIAKKSIMKSLIFSFIEKQKGLSITDEEVKESLENYYQQTNQPIRQILNDENEFAKVKASMREEKVMKAVIEMYKIKIELPKKATDSKESK
ncbi:MAG: hypothetical protein LBM76_02740 [Mycoplasmataceae bacterium]|jgi:hypothetical protein|nr:hypothetical protein [Mycoplasmataceae bacterium]